MKVQQLRDVLQETARQKEKAGNADASLAIVKFEKLLTKHNSKTVAALAKVIKSSMR